MNWDGYEESLAQKPDLIGKIAGTWSEPTPFTKQHTSACAVIALNAVGERLHPLALASGTRAPKLTIKNFNFFTGKKKTTHIYDV